MCTTCGCGLKTSDGHGQKQTLASAEEIDRVAVMRHLLDDNQRRALHNREHLDACGVLAVNLMSSPGSGKTALLEATVDTIASELKVAVIVGDLATDRDARRLRDRGVPAIQIGTGQACHLDAAMVHDAMHGLPLAELDLLFIENVGNLVCPASFDLGQHRSVTLLSVTEGDDKPAKYPVMFRASDLLLITKSDLLPHVDDFDPQAVESDLRVLANQAPVLSISSKRGDGMDDWLDWLHQQRLLVHGSAA